MKSAFLSILVLIAISALCSSCNSDGKENMASGNFANLQTDEAAITPEMLPYYTFARQLEESINNGLPDFFNTHFDTDILLSRLFRKLKAPKKFEQNFTLSVKSSVDAGAQVVASLDGVGTYKLLTISGLPDKPTALFRLSKNGSINYHEIYLTPAPSDDLVRIADFCIYKGGLSFSETLEMVLLSALSEQQNELDLNEFTETDRAALLHRETIDKLVVAVHEQAYGKALRLLKELPDILVNQKMLLLQRLDIGYHLKNNLLAEALAAFEQQYPGSAVPYFYLLDMAMEQKDNDNIVIYANELGKRLPDAAYLQIITATAFENKGDYESAEKTLAEVLRIEPDNVDAYRAMSVLYIENKQYEKAVALFDVIEQNIDTDPTELLAGLNYDDFWASDYYRNWENLTNETKKVIAP